MKRERHESLNNPGDREIIKKQLKQIRDAKARGDEVEAQRLANNLFAWLGWDQDGV